MPSRCRERCAQRKAEKALKRQEARRQLLLKDIQAMGLVKSSTPSSTQEPLGFWKRMEAWCAAEEQAKRIALLSRDLRGLVTAKTIPQSNPLCNVEVTLYRVPKEYRNCCCEKGRRRLAAATAVRQATLMDDLNALGLLEGSKAEQDGSKALEEGLPMYSDIKDSTQLLEAVPPYES